MGSGSQEFSGGQYELLKQFLIRDVEKIKAKVRKEEREEEKDEKVKVKENEESFPKYQDESYNQL